MATATKEKEIDGLTFGVTQLPAMRALKTLNRLGRALGPALARAAGGMKIEDLGSLDLSSLSDAVALLFERLPDAELEGLTRTLLESATVSGQELLPQFDLVMQGRISTVFKLLAFAIEVNYGDFFGVVRGLAAQAKARRSASEGSITSIRPGLAGG